MSIYTYSVHGIGFMPDPDSVQDHDTMEDAISAFYADVEVTLEHLNLDAPEDLPSEDDLTDALASGSGLAYGIGGWLHVIGVD